MQLDKKPFISFNISNALNNTEPVTGEDLLIQQIADPQERIEMLWHRFIRRLRLNAWGDHTVIQAIAHMLNTTIIILEYREQSSKWSIDSYSPIWCHRW